MFVVTRPTHFKPPDRNVFITFSVLKMDSRPLRSDNKLLWPTQGQNLLAHNATKHFMSLDNPS